MSSMDILFQIKRHLESNYSNRVGTKNLWYYNQGQYGFFSPEARQLKGDAKLQGLLADFDKSVSSYPGKTAIVTEKGKTLLDSALEEIQNYAKIPSTPLISGNKEYNPTLVIERDEWFHEIKKAAGNYDYLSNRAIVLAPAPVKASWDEEIYAASKALVDPLSCNSELREECLKFLAKCLPQELFTAECIDYDYGDFSAGEKVLNISGTLLRTSTKNKNGWSIEKSEVAELCRTLRGKNLTVDHSKSVKDIVGQISLVYEDGDYVKFAGKLDDPTCIKLVTKGRVSGVSVGMLGTGVCSVCGRVGMLKTCDDDGHIVVKNPIGQEITLTTRPAFSDAKIEQYSEEVEDA